MCPLRDTTLSFLVKRGERLHNFHPHNTVYPQNTDLTELAPRNTGMHSAGKGRNFSKYLCAEPLMVPNYTQCLHDQQRPPALVDVENHMA